jgi:hypothetical protein
MRMTSSAEIVGGPSLGALGMDEQPMMIPLAASVQIAWKRLEQHPSHTQPHFDQAVSAPVSISRLLRILSIG